MPVFSVVFLRVLLSFISKSLFTAYKLAHGKKNRNKCSAKNHERNEENIDQNIRVNGVFYLNINGLGLFMVRQHFSDKEINAQGAKADAFGIRMNIAIKRAGGVTKMSEKAGVSGSVLRKWRSEKSDPSRTSLIKVANAAGVSVEWLATGEGEIAQDSGQTASQEPIRQEKTGESCGDTHKALAADRVSAADTLTIPMTIYARLAGPLSELVPDEQGQREAVLSRSIHILRAATNDEIVDMLCLGEEELRQVVSIAATAYCLATERQTR